jgi:GrpB-like predicted nucleotidyltransferase (UPF0157 family)
VARPAPKPEGPLLGLRRGEVRVVRHRRAWAAAFERERRRLARLLGAGAVAIEHVGSTAVAGLAAKPILDVAVAAGSLRSAARWAPALGGAGYAAFGDREGRGEHFYAKGPEGRRTVYLHVVPARSANWANYLGFRDALRSSAALRAGYGRLKRRLGALHPRDRAAYTEAKAAFIRAALGRRGARCAATR